MVKRATIAAVIVTVIVVIATTVVFIDEKYSGSNGPGFAFLSEKQVFQITGENYNYSYFSQNKYLNNITSESLSLSTSPDGATPTSLTTSISEYDNTSLATHDYVFFLSILNTNASGVVLNASYSGFTYTYVHPSEGYPFETYFIAMEQNFVLTIQFHFTISNNSLQDLIQSQMIVMQ